MGAGCNRDSTQPSDNALHEYTAEHTTMLAQDTRWPNSSYVSNHRDIPGRLTANASRAANPLRGSLLSHPCPCRNACYSLTTPCDEPHVQSPAASATLSQILCLRQRHAMRDFKVGSAPEWTTISQRPLQAPPLGHSSNASDLALRMLSRAMQGLASITRAQHTMPDNALVQQA